MVDKRGFTLIEVIVVIAILTIVMTLGLFMSLDVYRGYQYRSERGVLVALLERARSHAMANVGQSAWGLCKEGDYYALFGGSAYSPGAVEESIPASKAATVLGVPECSGGAVVFAALSGTTTPATITVEQGTAPTATITLNDHGTIIW
jgi:prepilin-type N-terminal cleavage/methylation domain-containing protein